MVMYFDHDSEAADQLYSIGLLKYRFQHLRQQLNLLWGNKLCFCAHHFSPPGRSNGVIYLWTLTHILWSSDYDFGNI